MMIPAVNSIVVKPMVVVAALCAPLVAQAPTTPTEARQAAELPVHWTSPAWSDTGNGGIEAKILGINDFHGRLNGGEIDGRSVGGAGVLASYLEAEAAEVAGRAVIVHAGDMVGASPPVSALQWDQPTIEFLNRLGNEHCTFESPMDRRCNMVGTLGNHEFDKGLAELQRLLGGGTHPDADVGTTEWAGAALPYVTANILDNATGDTVVPPYVVKDIGGVRVGFVGALIENPPINLLGRRDVQFTDEAPAINRYVRELNDDGVEAIVVTIHHGLDQVPAAEPAPLEGDIIDIVRALDDAVDVVVSGHSHAYTNALIATSSGDHEILLTQAYSNGTAYSDIDIVLDPESGDIVAKSAAIMTTWADAGPGLSPDADIVAFVEGMNAELASLVERVVGQAAIDIMRNPNAEGESAMGNLLADSMRTKSGAAFAIKGIGGIRASIDAGPITWGELFAVSPFDGDLVTVTLTGDQIRRVLNQQWIGREEALFLQVSGLTYTWDSERDPDDRVVQINDATGQPLDPDIGYRVSTPAYYADGGDGFTVFAESINREIVAGELDTLVEYVRSQTAPLRVRVEGRVRRVD